MVIQDMKNGDQVSNWGCLCYDIMTHIKNLRKRDLAH